MYLVCHSMNILVLPEFVFLGKKKSVIILFTALEFAALGIIEALSQYLVVGVVVRVGGRENRKGYREHFIDLSFVCLFEEPRTPKLVEIRNILIISASGRKFLTAEEKKIQSHQ